MAIKFSQFVVRTNSSDLSHIVGYNGVDNIQITPTNFLNSALTGTAGQVLFYDTTGVTGDNDLYWDNTNKRLGIGTTSPSQKLDVAGSINLDGTSTRVFFGGNNTFVGENSNSNELILRGGGSGTSESVYIDTSGNVGIGTSNPSEKLEVDGNIKVGDSQQFIAGSNNDLRIIHDGTDSFINSNGSGDLYIQQFNDDKDIIFKSDNGSGGLATYFAVDGGGTDINFFKDTHHIDNVKAKFGSASTGDLQIYHDGTNSRIYNETGDVYIRNNADDKNIYFQSDNGSGGVTTYFELDGNNVLNKFRQNLYLLDNVGLKIGNGFDLDIKHDGSDSYIQNATGDLYIRNFSDDKDIIFQSDDGSGGVTTYFKLDGGNVDVSVAKDFLFQDNVRAEFGNAGDLEIYHNGTNNLIDSINGDISIRQLANDKDIRFRCDDGSGGETEYFRLDGGLEKMVSSKNIMWLDNIKAQFGDSNDLSIFHNSADTFIDNGTGSLNIRNQQDDGDINFICDNGSGGNATYFRLDGSLATGSRVYTVFPDNSTAVFGSGFDFQIHHDASNTYLQQGGTGDLYFQQNVNDRDIIFQADGGSGSPVEYMRLDGSQTTIRIKRQAKWDDNIKATFGDSDDLQIYHDGSNSFISDTGIGDLRILGSVVRLKSAGDENMIVGVENAGVTLYYDAVAKLTTTSTGVKITGVLEYADNTAAIAGGLTTGDVYRTGDLLKIVH